MVAAAPEPAPPPPAARPSSPAAEAPTWHLRQDDAGWRIELDGAVAPVAILRTRREALKRADTLAREARGRLIIHQASGTVERDHRPD